MKKLVLMLGCLIACATVAQAHAFLDHAEPKVGSTLTAPPAVVKIWFTRPIVHDGSDIEVYDAKGAEVDLKKVQIDRDDETLMSVSVETLPAGSYKVVWNAVCRDSHHTTGSFTFEVTCP